ncbi:MAG: P-loop NTPase [Acidobacteria bacterium]|nr:P-loop NTPase [Acidobacteriota bacterium]MCZ6745587.1 P-loop NTPase [Acidobacteriota bacterium]
MKSYFDITGDGGSDVLGQVARQRARIKENLAGVHHRVAIASGKGGVGKSTLTMQIALALRAGGSRVTILDADLNGPSQARLGGLSHAPLVPGPDGLSVPASRAGIGILSMGTMIPESKALEFDSVAEGDSHVWRSTREFAALADLLATVAWGNLDFLLIDLPPGAERTFQYAEFFGESTAFVLVTLPSALARGVVSRSVSALRRAPNKILGYIENMSGYLCPGCGQVKPLFPTADGIDLGLTHLGSVPFDPQLAALCDAGEPMPADSPSEALAATRSIASRLIQELEKAS